MGFTTFGPIFNVNIGLSVQHKDLLLTGFDVEIAHKDGDQHTFRWDGIVEPLSQARDATGLFAGQFERELKALGLKLTTSSVTSALIRFREVKFRKEWTSLEDAAVRHLAFLKSQGSEGFQDKFLESQQFHELLTYCRSAFWWKTGEYEVTLVPESNTGFRLSSAGSYTFELTKENVENLRDNLDHLKTALTNEVKAGLPGFTITEIPWSWSNPPLKPR